MAGRCCVRFQYAYQVGWGGEDGRKSSFGSAAGAGLAASCCLLMKFPHGNSIISINVHVAFFLASIAGAQLVFIQFKALARRRGGEGTSEYANSLEPRCEGEFHARTGGERSGEECIRCARSTRNRFPGSRGLRLSKLCHRTEYLPFLACRHPIVPPTKFKFHTEKRPSVKLHRSCYYVVCETTKSAGSADAPTAVDVDRRRNIHCCRCTFFGTIAICESENFAAENLTIASASVV